MREIKFRAWDRKDKRMFVPDGLKNPVNFTKNVEHMQFTGLHDHNGREIFEGDLIKSIEHEEVYKVDDIVPVHRHTHVTNIGYFSGQKYFHRDRPASRYDNMDDWMSWAE